MEGADPKTLGTASGSKPRFGWNDLEDRGTCSISTFSYGPRPNVRKAGPPRVACSAPTGPSPGTAGIDARSGVWHSVHVFVTNHVLAGALIGRRFATRPGTAFVIGFGSHLLMDMVPHWGCDVRQTGGSDRFLRAARRDGLLGLAVLAGCAWSADRAHLPATAAAIAGAVILDIDKPSQHFFNRNPVPDWLQRVHGEIQRESDRVIGVEVATGIALSAAEILASRTTARRNRRVHNHAPYPHRHRNSRVHAQVAPN